jgi:hypothetical protein
MAYRRVRNYGNTMGATSGTETANSSRAPEYDNADALSRRPCKVCLRHQDRNTEEKSEPECATTLEQVRVTLSSLMCITLLYRADILS